MNKQQATDIVKSPCVGVCSLDEQDLCIACKRSGMEIAEWGIYTPIEKREVLQIIEQRYADVK
jgi:predicted Fe-S protein YdhL (DUF1289 family)